MSSIDLYSYQRDAVDRMRDGCILCGGVGSGKSRTALAYYYKECGGNLDDESDIFSTMTSPIPLYIITTARKRDTYEWVKELGEFLINVNNIVVDSWNNIGKYKDVKDAFFIFDEQRVVGSGSWVRSFLTIAKHNRWILLSATPGDKWEDYIPVFIANGFYKNRTEFKQEHIVYSPYSKYPKVSRYLNTGRLIRLRNKILVTMDFNRSTIQHNEDVWVEYDIPKYKDLMRNRFNYDKDEPIKTASELCYALRCVVNSDISRAAAVRDIVEEKYRVIVFYNFDYELDILRSIPYPEGTIVSEWNGHKHESIPHHNRWVYLVQYNAGAEGWNCVDTDTIIFYSQNYSYKSMQQASGRIDRLNTPWKDLYFYHLKSRSGIDLAIDKTLKQKKDFNEMRFVRDERGYVFNR